MSKLQEKLAPFLLAHWTLLSVCLISSAAHAEDRLATIINNVQANEELYRDLELRSTETYTLQYEDLVRRDELAKSQTYEVHLEAVRKVSQ